LSKIIVKHKELGYNAARDAMFSQVDDPTNQDTVECVYTGRRETGVSDRTSAYQKKLNTEHTWPQSKGAEGVAKSDLHHLFPVDNDANSRRSSLPFGEIKASPLAFLGLERSGEGQDARGRQIYEPRDVHKGNLARALLYFYVCYRDKNLDLSNFRLEKDVLAKWSKQDPVDAAERFRNETIYRLQGNRNPFIDHPEYVEQIGNLPI
jgi:endonuclease I